MQHSPINIPNERINDLTPAEKIVMYLIDNQLINGLDAIVLLKAIIENQNKEPESMLLPREEKAPISIPSISPPKNSWEPNTTNPRPYDPLIDPMKVWREAKYNGLSTQSSVEINDDIVSVTGSPFQFSDSKVFNR